MYKRQGDILLQVDKDLNAVVVRSEKELSVPAKIGDDELTAADKYLVANGHSLDNKMIDVYKRQLYSSNRKIIFFC